MKWKKVVDVHQDLRYPAIVTDGKQVYYLEKWKPTWAWSTYVSYKKVIYYLPIEKIPHIKG